MAMSVTYALTLELDTFTPCILDKGNNKQLLNFQRMNYLIGIILATASKRFHRRQLEKVFEALRFAAKQHEGVYRKDDFTPYLLHVLEVACILIGKKVFDYSCIIAAIIHDVVEDTGAKIKEIKKRFGYIISRIVDLLSKHKNAIIRWFYWGLIRNEWDDNVRWRVIVIKFADRIHNLMTLDVMPEESQKRKIAETIKEFPELYKVLIKTLRKLRRKGVITNDAYLLLPFKLNNRLAHELSRYE